MGNEGTEHNHLPNEVAWNRPMDDFAEAEAERVFTARNAGAALTQETFPPSNAAAWEGPVLSLEGLEVEAGGVLLLRGVDLALRPSELVALTGPSGCGKTTLLRVVCGLQDPAQGRVVFWGEPAAAWGWPAFRRSVLLVEQKPVVVDASVEDNLKRPFAYQTAIAAGQRFPDAEARRLLDRLGLGGAARLEQNARSLSVGQQQRLCLVRALLLEPPVLLLDEPTSALDAPSAAVVEALIREEAARRNMAALVVTHDACQADAWCDRRFDLSGCMVAAFRAAGDN